MDDSYPLVRGERLDRMAAEHGLTRDGRSDKDLATAIAADFYERQNRALREKVKEMAQDETESERYGLPIQRGGIDGTERD